MPEKGQSAVYNPSSPTGFSWEHVLGIDNRRTQLFTPTQDQTEFILETTPLSVSGVFINGLLCEDHIVENNKVIFTGTAFSLSPTDIFRVNYYIK